MNTNKYLYNFLILFSCCFVSINLFAQPSCCTSNVLPNAGFESSVSVNTNFPYGSGTSNALQSTPTSWTYDDVSNTGTYQVFHINDATRASEGTKFIYLPDLVSTANHCVGTNLSNNNTCGSGSYFDGYRYIVSYDIVAFNQNSPDVSSGSTWPVMEHDYPAITNLFYEDGTEASSTNMLTAVTWAEVASSWQTVAGVTPQMNTGGTSNTVWYSNAKDGTCGILTDNTVFELLLISAANATNVTCGSSNNQITFDMSPDNNIPAHVPNIKYNVTVPAGYTISPTQANYNQNTSFTLTRTSGNFAAGTPASINVTVTDEVNTDCNQAAVINNPFPCQEISSAGLLINACNNQGTGLDSTDDTFTFSLNPSGTGLGATYDVSGDITGNGFSYGSVTAFDNGGSGYVIGNGNLSILITDVSTGETLPVTVTPPATCSNDLDIDCDGVGDSVDADDGNPCAPNSCASTCGFTTDDNITFTSSGGDTNGATLKYILTDNTGTIVETATSASFSNQTTAGFYYVYILAYESAATPTNCSVGDDILGVSFNESWACADMSCPLVVEVCSESNASIGNLIWVDENADGYQDVGEPGIANVMVELSDNIGTPIDTVITDANGGYLFSRLDANDYTIQVIASSLPNGLSQTTNPVNNNSDLGNQNQSYNITLGTDEENLTADFGFNWGDANGNSGLGAIGDYIWVDNNGDGIQDASEASISNVTVSIYTDSNSDGIIDPSMDALVAGALDQNGNPGGTTTTEANGFYIFQSLPAGAYVVVVDDSTLPGGSSAWTQTGDPDERDRTATVPDHMSNPVVLFPGDTWLNADFGYQSTTLLNSVGDKIYVDLDADGNYTSGESGVPSVTITLLDNLGVPIATTTTDSNGAYLFAGLPDGTYTVWVNDTDNVLSELSQSGDPDATLDNQSTVMLSGGNTDLNQDFGYLPNGHMSGDGAIGDLVFIDLDNDGGPSTGEGVEGVPVELFDVTGTNLLALTNTDENGNYLFGGLDASLTYTVKVDQFRLPGTVTNFLDPDGGNDNESIIDLSSAGPIDLTQDFGYRSAGTLGSLGNLVWEDRNANGVVDTGESGIEGVTLDLYWDINGNAMLNPGEPLLGSTVTDASGNYSFENLPVEGDETYIVDVTDSENKLTGYWHSSGAAGTDDHSHPDAYGVTLTMGESVAEYIDFGYYIDPASLGNTIWIDRDGDGLQDSDEHPMPMVPVTLTVTFPNGEVVTTVDTTDAQGHYGFNNLLLDEDYNTGGGGAMPDFVLSVGSPTNFLTTIIDANSNADDKADSDDPNGVSAMPIQGQENVVKFSDPTMETSEATYDFGFTLDCASPVVHYAITNGAISNPGQTTDYFYQDTVQNLATYTTHLELAAQDGIIRSIDYCDFGNWSYYYNSSDPDEYLFAIEHGDNVTPIEYIELCVDDNPADRYAVGQAYATYVMARDWFVRTKNNAPLLDASGNPTTVNIRFYFPEEEFKEILDEAITQAAIWGSKVPTVADVYWFKKETFDASLDIDNEGAALKPFDINDLRNAATTSLGVNTNDGTAGDIGNGKNHIQFNGITGFSGGTAAITIFNFPLSVGLSNFEAEVENCDVKLAWTTESESNFSHYILESSIDGINYEFVEQVEALQSIETEKHYNYEDVDITNTMFYRLKMVDLDGAHSYSNVVSADPDCVEISGLDLFPNPVGLDLANLNVNFNSKKEIETRIVITNTIGSIQLDIPMVATKGMNNVNVDVSNLPEGIYIVTVRNVNQKIASKKFLKSSQ